VTRTIASRASWGARYQNGVGSRPAKGLQKYLHHSVTRHLPRTASVAQERAECRTVERIGQQRFGAGISYTILLFPSGRLYWGAGIDRISYHSGGGNDGKPRNTIGVGICLVGNTHANDMTQEQEDALVWLLRHGVRQGWWNDPAITEGHRDFKATSCPGDYAYRRIDRINRRARGGTYADYRRNGLPDDSDLDPKPTPTPTPERTWFDMATKNDLRDVVRAELADLFDQRIKLTGSSKEAFGPDFRAGALLAYAARGGLTAHEPTVQAIGKLVGKSTSEILAAIAEANADVELPEDDDPDTDDNQEG